MLTINVSILSMTINVVMLTEASATESVRTFELRTFEILISNVLLFACSVRQKYGLSLRKMTESVFHRTKRSCFNIQRRDFRDAHHYLNPLLYYLKPHLCNLLLTSCSCGAL